MMLAGTQGERKCRRYQFRNSYRSRKQVSDRRHLLPSQPCRIPYWKVLASRKGYLQVGIGAPPQEWNPRRPVLAIDGSARPRVILSGQYPGCGSQLRSSHYAANCAGSHAYLRIVADAFVLPGDRSSHHKEFAVLFPEPHWSGHGLAILAEGLQRDVFLALNGSGDRTGHTSIVRVKKTEVLSGNRWGNKIRVLHWSAFRSGLCCRPWFAAASLIARTSVSVLKDCHAQMDAR